jgi:hypothetical protein
MESRPRKSKSSAVACSRTMSPPRDGQAQTETLFWRKTVRFVGGDRLGFAGRPRLPRGWSGL